MKRIALTLVCAVLTTISALAAPPTLACEKLFSDKYKRHKNTEMTINRSSDSYFRQLRVDNNRQIVAEIENAVAADSKIAFNTVHKFNYDTETFIMNIQYGNDFINIGFNKYSDTNAKIFIEGPPEAFK